MSLPFDSSWLFFAFNIFFIFYGLVFIRYAEFFSKINQRMTSAFFYNKFPPHWVLSSASYRLTGAIIIAYGIIMLIFN